MRKAKSPSASADIGITGGHIQQHQLTQSSSVRSVDGQPPLAATDATRRVRAARRYMVSVLGVSLTISWQGSCSVGKGHALSWQGSCSSINATERFHGIGRRTYRTYTYVQRTSLVRTTRKWGLSFVSLLSCSLIFQFSWLRQLRRSQKSGAIIIIGMGTNAARTGQAESRTKAER